MSPKALANALSGTTQLRFLSLHFLSPASRPSHTGISPLPGERIVLPALSRFKFQGTSEYLNNFVTRIDSPRLGDIEVRFFNQLIFHISQLRCFIERIDMQRSHCQADILSIEHAISITFTQPIADVRLKLQISCGELDWQLSSMAQICDQFSSSGFLLGVGDLRIDTMHPSRGRDDGDSEHWPEVIHPFGGIEKLSLDGKLVTHILRTLREADRETGPLPSLKYLRTQGPGSGDVRVAIDSFVTQRRLSGRPIEVYGLDGAPYKPLDYSAHALGRHSPYPEPSESVAKKYKEKTNVRHYRAQNKDAMTQLRDALPEHMRPPERLAKAYVVLRSAIEYIRELTVEIERLRAENVRLAQELADRPNRDPEQSSWSSSGDVAIAGETNGNDDNVNDDVVPKAELPLEVSESAS
ncbi:hypothetical protein EDB83DRAFT_2407232 [Lactarius deliciosus]|nr:hypothetical protein EDB83DRAFT_2407232 [Lactarius deliciosus]